jgi:hypothetical protein
VRCKDVLRPGFSVFIARTPLREFAATLLGQRNKAGRLFSMEREPREEKVAVCVVSAPGHQSHGNEADQAYPTLTDLKTTSGKESMVISDITDCN